jgi:hypothetical protein
LITPFQKFDLLGLFSSVVLEVPPIQVLNCLAEGKLNLPLRAYRRRLSMNMITFVNSGFVDSLG